MSQARYEAIVCWKLLCSFARILAMTAVSMAVVFPTVLLLSMV